MFSMTISGPVARDETAPYAVSLDRPYTVKDFIDAVIANNPKEWGRIYVHTVHDIFACPSCEYRYGVVDQGSGRYGALTAELLGKPVKSASANGGWSNMDYVLNIGALPIEGIDPNAVTIRKSG